MQRNLETHRFNINPESVKLMHEMKELFEKLRNNMGFVEGISFFGSRVIGQESHNSDLDLMVFYDQSKVMKTEVIPPDTSVKMLFHFRMHQLRLPIDPVRTIVAVDISQESTDKAIKNFENAVSLVTKDFTKTLAADKLDNEGNFSFAGRFFLGVGEGLYQNRRYILDRFDRDKKNGEKYFRALMEYLKYTERTLKERSNYLNYPESTEKARSFFLNK